MPSTIPPSTDPKSLETRFGLVMYGGVSLAIYINGVAQEFFNAVRGRGVYKFIKALTDTNIVVDIVSGTSAGGINGIMLAYALCNKKEFSDSANLWRSDGDIRRLLRAPYGRAKEAWSLLDSEGFYQPQLETAFRDMRNISANMNEDVTEFTELDLFVTGTDVDGNRSTQFDDAGHPIDVKDHRSIFHLKHREGRKEPFNPDFKAATDLLSSREVTYKALGKLSRITSCFPGAFSPVTVTHADAREASADGRLQLWGKLGKESTFLDGGLIDNKPFTYTLREIFFRAAVGKVERKLFYIEPDPEHWEKLETATQPNFFEAIVASLIGIPGYESISEDLKMLGSHNSKIKRYNRVVSFLDRQKEKIEPPTPQVEELYKRSRLIALSEWILRSILKIEGRNELLNPETRRKGEALVKAFDEAVMPNNERGKSGSKLDDLLKDFDTDFRLRRIFRTVYFIRDRVKQIPSAVLVSEELTEAELDRLYKEICDDERLRSGARDVFKYKNLVNALKYKKLWKALNRQLELMDIIRAAMEKVLDEANFDWHENRAEDVWTSAQRVLQHLLDGNSPAAKILTEAATTGEPYEWLDNIDLKDFNMTLRALSDEITGVTISRKSGDHVAYDVASGTVISKTDFVSILRIIEDRERKMIEHLLPDKNNSVRMAYEEFVSLDSKLYPVEFISELNEKDIIKTYRISPHDAKKGFSNKGLSDKVSGDALYHFGGFFKRSWRSNDILWGRLDCQCQLIETLLDPERLKEVLTNPYLRQKVRARFYDEWKAGAKPKLKQSLSPAHLFKNAGAHTHREIEKWLGELLLGDYASPEEAAKGLEPALAKCAAMSEYLIEAAQLEIIVSDLPNVIEDSLEEQIGWNQFRVNKNKFEAQRRGGARKLKPEDNPFEFKSPNSDVDPFFGVIAAAGQTVDWMRAMTSAESNGNGASADEAHAEEAAGGGEDKKPTDTRLGKFFREDYKVGTEALLRDMPPLVLLEIVSVSLLVLRNCLLDIFEKNTADRVRKHPLYIATVDLPLRAFNLMVRFLRRAPRWEKGILTGASLLSALVIVFATLGREEILKSGGSFSIVRFSALIVVPALVIYASYIYLRRETGKKKGKLWATLRWFGAWGNALLALLPLLAFGLVVWLVPAGETPLKIIGRTFTFDKYNLRIIMLLACGLAFVGPYLALFSAHGLFNRRRIKALANELSRILENYFSVEEMLRVARRLVPNLSLKWDEVQDLLEQSACGNAARMGNLKKLKEHFGSSKIVRWEGLRNQFEKLNMFEEMWLVAEKCNIPLEDEDWQLNWKRAHRFIRSAAIRTWGSVARFDEKFRDAAKVRWGDVQAFMWEADMGDELMTFAEKRDLALEDVHILLEREVVRKFIYESTSWQFQEIERLGEMFSERDKVSWRELRKQLRERELLHELKDLRVSPDSPLFEDWRLECSDVLQSLSPVDNDPEARNEKARLKAAFSEQFINRGHNGNAQSARWGDLQRFFADKRVEKSSPARANLYNALLRRGDRNWPYIGVQEPESWERLPALMSRRQWKKRSWEEGRGHLLADKLVRWAKQSGNLRSLAAHMRFVNPEALYGE